RTSSMCVVPTYLLKALPENLSEKSSGDPFRHFECMYVRSLWPLEMSIGIRHCLSEANLCNSNAGPNNWTLRPTDPPTPGPMRCYGGSVRRSGTTFVIL
nr:hypothetical protein [Tanacetum cinerariifolium]